MTIYESRFLYLRDQAEEQPNINRKKDSSGIISALNSEQLIISQL